METLEKRLPESPTLGHVMGKPVYDFKVASPDGTNPDILSKYEGKVTLLFNCSAGCGNVPQHMVLKELDERYADEPDFNLQAIVVDDFTCHGYPEFGEGLEAYAKREGLDLTPGQVAEYYGRENYGVEYGFSELTNARFDKHSYDSDWIPGAQYEQEPHPLWLHLTGAAGIPRGENNIPHHWEVAPFAPPGTEEDRSKPGFCGVRGNFEKYLVTRDGYRFIRYPNTFLLGQSDRKGKDFPWWSTGTDDAHLDGEYRFTDDCDYANHGPWPTELQRKGIDHSLDLISEDIDRLLAA